VHDPGSRAVIRHVRAHLEIDVETPARLLFHLAVALGPTTTMRTETLLVTNSGRPEFLRELPAANGGRLHLLDVQPGRIVLDYEAIAEIPPVLAPLPIPPDYLELDAALLDEFQYLLPSRYCESDRLLALANSEFGQINGRRALLAAVTDFVRSRLYYVPGSSGPTDGAVDTLLAGQGVCRDYAHLTVALLRAMEVPARLVAVYAPGLDPMDFHAVAEAYVDGEWLVADSTGLAPRQSLVRIATGRDAADTAFMSNYGGFVTLQGIEVMATVDGDLPLDDHVGVVRLA
jgi:transglutaminase-like putative cysteine protease